MSSRTAGFSLIEVIFAMIFITMIIMGVVNLQSSNLSLINTQNNEVKAHFIASEGLEIAEGLGFVALNTGCPTRTCNIGTSGGDYTIGNQVGDPEQVNGLFDRTITLDPTGLTNAFLVAVDVEWDDSTGFHGVTAKRIVSQ